MEREEDIPALIYEARPVVRPWCPHPHRCAMAKQAACKCSSPQAYKPNPIISERHASASCSFSSFCRRRTPRSQRMVTYQKWKFVLLLKSAHVHTAQEGTLIICHRVLAWHNCNPATSPLHISICTFLSGTATQAAAQPGARRLWHSSAAADASSVAAISAAAITPVRLFKCHIQPVKVPCSAE